MLDERLRRHTSGRMGLDEAVSGYLEAICHASCVLGLVLNSARLDHRPIRIEITLSCTPELLISWTSSIGWAYRSGHGPARYRVASRSATSIVPDADNVAAWIGVLARGHRPGHPAVSQDPAQDDHAVVDRLATFGEGRTPHEQTARFSPLTSRRGQ